MKKIAVILALAFALTTGMTLTTAFGCGLFPLLSNAACFIAKDGTGQLPHLVALPPPILLGGLRPNVPQTVTKITAHPTLYCFVVIAPFLLGRCTSHDYSPPRT